MNFQGVHGCMSALLFIRQRTLKPVGSYVSSTEMARLHNQISRHRAEDKCSVEEPPQCLTDSFPLLERRIRKGAVQPDPLHHWWKWKWLLIKQFAVDGQHSKHTIQQFYTSQTRTEYRYD